MFEMGAKFCLATTPPDLLNSFHMLHILKVESKLSEAVYRVFICIKFRNILTYISLPGFPLNSI